MSYDVSIRGWSGNYTSNLGQLFYDYLPEKGPNGRAGLPGLHGVTGARAARQIDEALVLLGMAGPRELVKYDAENGWGDYHGAIRFLREIKAACEDAPRCRVHVDW